jgi:hypothetical protein
MGLKQKPPVTKLPELKQWSDVIFLQWSRLHFGTQLMRNIKYIIQSPCENVITQRIVAHALARRNQKLQRWPGIAFTMASEEGNAILGSPSGYGVGYLLAQHKRFLGRKCVEKIVIFMDEGIWQPRPPSLLFYLEDVAVA